MPKGCSLTICACGFAVAIHLFPWTETLPVPGISAHPEGSDFPVAHKYPLVVSAAWGVYSWCPIVTRDLYDRSLRSLRKPDLLPRQFVCMVSSSHAWNCTTPEILLASLSQTACTLASPRFWGDISVSCAALLFSVLIVCCAYQEHVPWPHCLLCSNQPCPSPTGEGLAAPFNPHIFTFRMSLLLKQLFSALGRGQKRCCSTSTVIILLLHQITVGQNLVWDLAENLWLDLNFWVYKLKPNNKKNKQGPLDSPYMSLCLSLREKFLKVFSTEKQEYFLWLAWVCNENFRELTMQKRVVFAGRKTHWKWSTEVTMPGYINLSQRLTLPHSSGEGQRCSFI